METVIVFVLGMFFGFIVGKIKGKVKPGVIPKNDLSFLPDSQQISEPKKTDD